MKWKNRLKTILAEAAKSEKYENCLEMALTKTDKTNPNVVSSVFVSAELTYFPGNSGKIGNSPKCSNCGLEMNLIENNSLWFCPLGCESRKADQRRLK